MKKWILGCVMICFALVGMYAQPGPSPERGGERVKALRTAFITNQLQLTPEEAQGFWPVFNQFEAEQKKLREKYKPTKDLLSMTDVEAEQLLNSQLEMEEEMLQLKKDYHQRFKKVLPVRKVAMLSRVEREFRDYLVVKLKEMRAGQRSGQPGGQRPGLRNR